MSGYDAVILAGGAARRLAGADKPGLLVGGVSLLDRVLGAVAGAGRIVVAGPTRPTRREVVWVREDPPGGGPVAGLAAALPRVRADVVVLLAADLPFVTAGLIERLVAEAGPAGVAARSRWTPTDAIRSCSRRTGRTPSGPGSRRSASRPAHRCAGWSGRSRCAGSPPIPTPSSIATPGRMYAARDHGRGGWEQPPRGET